MKTLAVNALHGQVPDGPLANVIDTGELPTAAGTLDLSIAGLRRIHSFSVLAFSSISCRSTRYPGQSKILANSLSVGKLRAYRIQQIRPAHTFLRRAYSFIRAAHGNHSQRQGRKTERVWEVGSIVQLQRPRTKSLLTMRSTMNVRRTNDCSSLQWKRTNANLAAHQDAGYYSRAHEERAHEMGVAYVSIPNRSTRSEDRRKFQNRPWFKNGQRWRTGCEGRISILKRRHGLARPRYHGVEGMRRWVGLGVIADNLINIGKRLAPAST